MIQIIGKTELYFHSDQTFLSDINYHLHQSLESFEVLFHEQQNKRHKITISFILHMEEKIHCRTLMDYNSYAYDEFKNRLPDKIHTSYMQTLDIRPAGKRKRRNGKAKRKV
ncbi:hypothetical protein [Aquibacillus salsiterrae]|uniref:Uncharacterized protein n=1 Tax=Aquibacillus salsiterrae TaxID=2950439 RepID=A0A9X3WF92_9BACI|nr:hypothetical protein [Aquibacillus salsiterrae]MDC3417588.1 hypothetical protein [Aquibacillus salsiterrae]